MREFIVSVKFALHNLRSNVSRTVLTLVGIVIAIMSVIVVMSSGQGLKNYIMGEFSSYGNDEISIKTKVPSTSLAVSREATAQGVQITTLKMDDLKAVQKIPNVKAVVAASIGQQVVSYQNQSKNLIIYGAGADMPAADTGVKIAQGEFYTSSDDDSLNQVAVIGSQVASDFFGLDNPLGKVIKIKNTNFRVVGVLEPRGAVTFFNYDDLIYVPEQTLQKKILGVNYVQAAVVKVKDANAVDEAAADITDTLRQQHHISDPSHDDFQVMTVAAAIDMIGSVMNTLTIMLLALTCISLVVGGVGIMNVMYVSVVERTFEIGLRKAVGAKSKDILRQFLLEAVIVTLIGGAIGIFLGFVLAQVFSSILSAFGFALQFSVTANSILIATGFSVVTGIAFGFYPAVKASKLSPMEALRRE
jgi:ABC-type antimicrobial peptide transport system permease subunit